MGLLGGLCVLCGAIAWPQGFSIPETKLLDLTHPFDASTVYWPTAQPFQWQKERWGRAPGGYFYAAGRFQMSEHVGTHRLVDAAPSEAALIERFLLYRTYHGCAMNPAVQHASIAAWGDEAHVRENRRLYAHKYAAVLPLMDKPLETGRPDGGFYLWVETPIDDADFARRLYEQYNVMVLPGSFLARESGGVNPGRNRLRVALVAPLAECTEAAQRMMQLARSL